MEIKKIEYDLTVCKIDSEKRIDLTKQFYFIGKTEEEISLVAVQKMYRFTPVLVRMDGKHFEYKVNWISH